MDPIYFYHPEATPSSITNQDNLVFDKKSAIDSWIIPTYAALVSAGLKVDLGNTPPDRGVVVASSYSLFKVKMPVDAFVVSLLADGFVHPRADFTVVQNLEQSPFCGASAFMPHWPERDLITRSESRGTRIETMAYFGHPSNLVPEVSSILFQTRLFSELGVTLTLPDAGSWHDYSAVDLVLAIRPEGGKVWPGCKPATKLYNAWLAGTPLIGGYESAFLAASVPGRDYFATHNVDGVLAAIRKLKSEAGLFESIVSRGHQNAKMLTHEAIGNDWVDLIHNNILPNSRDRRPQTKSPRLKRELRARLYRLKRRGTF